MLSGGSAPEDVQRLGRCGLGGLPEGEPGIRVRGAEYDDPAVAFRTPNSHIACAEREGASARGARRGPDRGAPLAEGGTAPHGLGSSPRADVSPVPGPRLRGGAASLLQADVSPGPPARAIPTSLLPPALRTSPHPRRAMGPTSHGARHIFVILVRRNSRRPVDPSPAPPQHSNEAIALKTPGRRPRHPGRSRPAPVLGSVWGGARRSRGRRRRAEQGKRGTQ